VRASELAEQIGDLLVRCGAVTPELLRDAVRIADMTNNSLGRTFEANGYLSEASVEELAPKLKIQIENKEISLEDAVDLMEAVGRRGVDLATAMRQLRQGAYISVDKSSNKLGQLMALAGIISQEHFSQGLYDSLNTTLPLGMVLVEKEIVLPAVLEWCLTAQAMVNAGALSEDEAAHALRVARLKGCDLKQSLLELKLSTQGLEREFGLGDLLIMANYLTATQLLAVREFSLSHDKEVNDVFLDLGMVREEIVDASQQLLLMVKEGVLTKEQAALIVRKLCRCSNVEEMMEILSNLEKAVTHSQEAVQVLDLIGMCQLVTPEQLAQAIAESRKANSTLLKTMVDIQMLTPQILISTNLCKATIDSGVLELEQGVMALTYAAENQTTFSEALVRFGWHQQGAAVK